MRIRVDEEKCQGHARCYGFAPTLFDIDDFGLSRVVGDGTVPTELEGAARLAIANCPEFAIEELSD
jgi:ferredoxin